MQATADHKAFAGFQLAAARHEEAEPPNHYGEGVFADVLEGAVGLDDEDHDGIDD